MVLMGRLLTFLEIKSRRNCHLWQFVKMANISDRLRIVSQGMKVAEIARKCNIAHNSVKRYLEGETPSVEIALIISREFNIEINWLLTGEGPMLRGEVAAPANDAMVAIPRLDVRAAAGRGVENFEGGEVRELIRLNRDYLRQLSLDPAHLAVIEAIGDSMTPTIQEGNLLVVDTRTDRYADAICVIRRAGELLVKRVQKLRDGSILIRSDNPAYREEVIPPSTDSQEDFAIAGRVALILKRI